MDKVLQDYQAGICCGGWTRVRINALTVLDNPDARGPIITPSSAHRDHRRKPGLRKEGWTFGAIGEEPEASPGTVSKTLKRVEDVFRSAVDLALVVKSSPLSIIAYEIRTGSGGPR